MKKNPEICCQGPKKDNRTLTKGSLKDESSSRSSSSKRKLILLFSIFQRSALVGVTVEIPEICQKQTQVLEVKVIMS